MPLLYKSRIRSSNFIDGLSPSSHSSNEDPHLEFNIQPQASGWYKLDVKINTPIPYFHSKIYLDYGQGYNEADSYNLPMKANEWTRQLVYLRAEVLNIRFDPFDIVEQFQLEHLELSPVSIPKALTLAQRSQALTAQNKGGLLELLKTKSHSQLPLTNNVPLAFDNIRYHQWIHYNEQDQPYSPETVQAILDGMSYTPVISVLMPVYNVDPVYLDEAITSVASQQYPHWELCIADDNSPSEATRACLKKWEAEYPNIKVVYRAENGHISANSNSALELVTGEYTALMDHDDTIRPHALLELARALNEDSELLFIYSDEDKLDSEGIRNSPHFKSGWNPDLFYAQYYLNHLTCLQTKRLKEIGGWQVGYEGSQDYDLYLRFLDGVTRERVHHIPKILYHWRAIEGSTALDLGEKNYAVDRGIQAASDFFQQKDSRITVDQLPHVPHYRINWPLPKPKPLVSIIIPTKDYVDTLKVCIDSLLEKSSYKNFEILVVDNNSEEKASFKYFEEIQRHKKIRVLPYKHPFNYSAINNFAVEQAQGEYIVLMNNDIEIINEDWLEQMLIHASREDIGCVGAKLYYPDDTIQHGAVILGIGGVAGHSHKNLPREHSGYFAKLRIPHSVSAVTAAMLMVKKEIFHEVNGLNEEHLTVAFNDVDFCLKVMTAGYRNLWTPFAEAYHYESKSRGHEDSPEKIERFEREQAYMKESWQGLLNHDPYYPANLTLTREDYSYSVNN